MEGHESGTLTITVDLYTKSGLTLCCLRHAGRYEPSVVWSVYIFACAKCAYKITGKNVSFKQSLDNEEMLKNTIVKEP